MDQAGARARTAQRSLLATVEITGAAMLAHVLAGGRLPGAGFLFAFVAVVFGCCLLAIGRLVRALVVVPLVLAAQVGLHAALEAGAAHGTAHGADHTASGPATSTFLDLTPVMFWAHVVTALVTAILLLLHERLVATAVAWWVQVDLTPCALPLLEPIPAVVPAPAAKVGLLRVFRRRGPPVVLAA